MKYQALFEHYIKLSSQTSSIIESQGSIPGFTGLVAIFSISFCSHPADISERATGQYQCKQVPLNHEVIDFNTPMLSESEVFWIWG